MEAKPDQDAKRVSSTDAVLQAIVDAREYGRVSSRRTIAEATALPMAVVDDRIKYLKTIGKVRNAGAIAGLFEPEEDRSEDRAVSLTILPNGRVKLEIGSHVLDLSMREARHIGAAAAGFCLQFRGGC